MALYQNTVRRIEERFPHVVGDTRYSQLQVLSSNAGFFIGRLCWVEEDGLPGYQDMGSRETEYFKTREEAQRFLDSDTFDVRGCAENEFAYSQGLPQPHKTKDGREK